jgi:hypothetical protein
VFDVLGRLLAEEEKAVLAAVEVIRVAGAFHEPQKAETGCCGR